MSKASSECGTPRIFNLFQIVDPSVQALGSLRPRRRVRSGVERRGAMRRWCARTATPMSVKPATTGTTSSGMAVPTACTVEPDWSAANAITFSSGALNDKRLRLELLLDVCPRQLLGTPEQQHRRSFHRPLWRGRHARDIRRSSSRSRQPADDDFIGIVFGFNDGIRATRMPTTCCSTGSS